jgi:hypothetical protein
VNYAAALGNCIDLIDDTLKAPLIIQEGESFNILGSLVDLEGAAIIAAALQSFELTLYDDATNQIIDSVQDENILNVGKGTVDAQGNFVIRLQGAQTPIVDTTLADKAVEVHIARLKWTWSDGVLPQDRIGIQEIRHRVQKLDAPT